MAVRVCVCACVRACVWKSTPRTADVTVTKIAGYVRVRILMNRGFFSNFWHSEFFKILSTFTRRVHMHLHAHKLCTHAEPCDWSGVHMALQQCWGCHCGPGGTQFMRRRRLLACA